MTSSNAANITKISATSDLKNKMPCSKATNKNTRRLGIALKDRKQQEISRKRLQKKSLRKNGSDFFN